MEKVTFPMEDTMRERMRDVPQALASGTNFVQAVVNATAGRTMLVSFAALAVLMAAYEAFQPDLVRILLSTGWIYTFLTDVLDDDLSEEVRLALEQEVVDAADGLS